MAKNNQQGERASRIQDMEGRRGQKTELLGGDGLMAPFSTRRDGKDSDVNMNRRLKWHDRVPTCNPTFISTEPSIPSSHWVILNKHFNTTGLEYSVSA